MMEVIFNYKKIIVCIGICFCFLAFRIVTTQSLFYSFLVWNLFLATLPLLITTILLYFKVTHNLMLGFSFFIWLLFLPNAPYIITDLAHLKRSQPTHLWIDLMVILVFSFSGLVLFYKSFFQMRRILNQITSKKIISFSSPFIFYLIGFGIYLGRVLRYNSWDIIHPKDLFFDCLRFMTQPIIYFEVWEFTFLFGSLLWLGNYILKPIFKSV